MFLVFFELQEFLQEVIKRLGQANQLVVVIGGMEVHLIFISRLKNRLEVVFGLVELCNDCVEHLGSPFFEEDWVEELEHVFEYVLNED